MHYIDWSWWWGIISSFDSNRNSINHCFFHCDIESVFCFKVKRTVKESGFAARIKNERMRENMQRSKFKDNWKS